MSETPNRLNDTMLRVFGPLIVTLCILGAFGFAFYSNPSDAGLLEILKSVTVLAIGFWLGSSSGSKGSAVVPGITTPPAPPATAVQPAQPVVVQTGSPAVAEAAQPAQKGRAGKGVDLIQGL